MHSWGLGRTKGRGDSPIYEILPPESVGETIFFFLEVACYGSTAELLPEAFQILIYPFQGSVVIDRFLLQCGTSVYPMLLLMQQLSHVVLIQLGGLLTMSVTVDLPPSHILQPGKEAHWARGVPVPHGQSAVEAFVFFI